MLWDAERFFPGVPPSEHVRSNLDAVGAELFDHLGPVWTLEELLGRLGSQESRFAVGQDPSRMTVIEDLRIDYVRDLLAYYAPISSSCCITSLRRYFSAESRSQSLKLGPARKPHG